MPLLRILLRTSFANLLSVHHRSGRRRLVLSIYMLYDIHRYTFSGAAYIVLNPEYAKPTHRGARTGVFIGLGFSAVVPVTHLLVSHGVSKLFSEMGFGWLLASGGLYITGALI
jgi:predicted membrane channel-forming protein YqfA (hemolysin III family)